FAVCRSNEKHIIVGRVDWVTQVLRLTPFIGLRIKDNPEDIMPPHAFVAFATEIEGNVVLVDEWALFIKFRVDFRTKVSHIRPLTPAVKHRTVNVYPAKSTRTVTGKIKRALVGGN